VTDAEEAKLRKANADMLVALRTIQTNLSREMMMDPFQCKMYLALCADGIKNGEAWK